MSRPFYPNSTPTTLRAILVSVDPKQPSRGGPNTLERESVIVGFERNDSGDLEPVLLMPQAPGEVLFIADTSNTKAGPTWFDMASGERFTRWADVIDCVMHRFMQQPGQVLAASPLTEPSIGPAGDGPWGTGQEPGRPRWKPEVSIGGVPPGRR